MNKLKTAHTYSYKAYMDYFTGILNQPVLPPLPATAKGDFRKLNLQRMDKWNKIYEPAADSIAKIEDLPAGMTWYVFAELNCGDSAQSLPVMAKIAEAAHIDLRIILKEDHLDLMNLYLSNGTQSVPKLVAFDKNGEEVFQWGARPSSAYLIYQHFRENRDTIAWEDFEKELHLWYARNKGVETEFELVSLLSTSVGSLSANK